MLRSPRLAISAGDTAVSRGVFAFLVQLFGILHKHNLLTDDFIGFVVSFVQSGAAYADAQRVRARSIPDGIVHDFAFQATMYVLFSPKFMSFNDSNFCPPFMYDQVVGELSSELFELYIYYFRFLIDRLGIKPISQHCVESLDTLRCFAYLFFLDSSELRVANAQTSVSSVHVLVAFLFGITGVISSDGNIPITYDSSTPRRFSFTVDSITLKLIVELFSQPAAAPDPNRRRRQQGDGNAATPPANGNAAALAQPTRNFSTFVNSNSTGELSISAFLDLLEIKRFRDVNRFLLQHYDTTDL